MGMDRRIASLVFSLCLRNGIIEGIPVKEGVSLISQTTLRYQNQNHRDNVNSLSALLGFLMFNAGSMVHPSGQAGLIDGIRISPASAPLKSSHAARKTLVPMMKQRLDHMPPLEDRVFLVTGSTDGIGKMTAGLLAKEGCTVLVHGRNAAKVDKVVADLRKQNPKIHGFVADISSMAEVRRLAAEVKAKFPILHGIANNAGTFAGDYTFSRKVTAEGNEYSLAVNVMAPFLLTSLLLENVRASRGGRVLITSSISAGSNGKLSDLQCEEGWSDHTAYELSKLCDAMIVMECDARYADPPHLTFHTMDPGTVDTKMLNAGWGRGAPVSSATTTSKMLTQDEYQINSGSGQGYCRGEGPDSRVRLWKQLEQLTGAQWPQ